MTTSLAAMSGTRMACLNRIPMIAYNAPTVRKTCYLEIWRHTRYNATETQRNVKFVVILLLKIKRRSIYSAGAMKASSRLPSLRIRKRRLASILIMVWIAICSSLQRKLKYHL